MTFSGHSCHIFCCLECNGVAFLFLFFYSLVFFYFLFFLFSSCSPHDPTSARAIICGLRLQLALLRPDWLMFDVVMIVIGWWWSVEWTLMWCLIDGWDGSQLGGDDHEVNVGLWHWHGQGFILWKDAECWNIWRFNVILLCVIYSTNTSTTQSHTAFPSATSVPCKGRAWPL